MNRITSGLATAAAAGILLTAPPSCQRQKQNSARTDLKEAGYDLTADGWFRASRENDVAALRKFVAGGFDKSTKDAAGDSALHAAAAAGALEAADFLLDSGVPVDVRGADERTPLMASISGGSAEMARYLLRQGADPLLKDKDGFRPLMMAVRDGKSAAVPELAAYDRDDLDSALLLAAMLGRTKEIDALTNFGASVYARMDDGRSALMLAAENGHEESVQLLMDIGASRFGEDAEGRTAADFAREAGHPELAETISRDPLPAELSLDTTQEIAAAMDEYVTAAEEGSPAPAPTGNRPAPSRPAVASLEGARLGGATSPDPASPASPDSPEPLVMRHYRERAMPLRVKSVRGESVVFSMAGSPPREVTVAAGGTIPGTDLVVVSARRRVEDSKSSHDGSEEISVVRVKNAGGETREWMAGRPGDSHEPVALVEDAATGRRYFAAPGQKFSGPDGAEYEVTDVRPSQLVTRNIGDGTVRTIRLHGPRG